MLLLVILNLIMQIYRNIRKDNILNLPKIYILLSVFLLTINEQI